MDEAREFDQLPPEESRARLGKIVDRIDSNEDGYEKLRTYMLPIYFKKNVRNFLQYKLTLMFQICFIG